MGAGVTSLPLLPLRMTEKSCKAGKQMSQERGAEPRLNERAAPAVAVIVSPSKLRR
jgi:hypothetical protein